MGAKKSSQPRGRSRAACTSCGEPIADGNTVYDVDGALFCPSCIKSSLTVYRVQPPPTSHERVVIETDTNGTRHIVFIP